MNSVMQLQNPKLNISTVTFGVDISPPLVLESFILRTVIQQVVVKQSNIMHHK